MKFNVTVSIPVAASEASMCQVPNTAKITVPAGGAAPNLDAGDDQSSATAWTFGLFWEDPITHITFVMCDPTNLKVEKTAKGDCEKSGEGFACGYDVTVTNTGPDPYKGPVRLDEKFGNSAAKRNLRRRLYLRWRRRGLQMRNADCEFGQGCQA